MAITQDQLTRIETAALWHAITNYELMIKQMPGIGCTPDQISTERERLVAAKRALRKVNKMRAQSKSAKATVTDLEKQTEEVPRTAAGYKQKPLTLNMLRSLHHLLAGRKNPKYREFYMGYWGLRERGLATDTQEVTELGKKVATENASVMAQFSAGKVPDRTTTKIRDIQACR